MWSSSTSVESSPPASRPMCSATQPSSRHTSASRTRKVVMTVLKVDAIRVAYGGIEALRGVTFEVEEGEIVTLLGANGAGKTTTLRAISGLLRPRQGTITLDGDRIDTVAPHTMVTRGLGHVPEGRRIFPRM